MYIENPNIIQKPQNTNLIKNPQIIYNPRSIQNSRVIYNPSIITPDYYKQLNERFNYTKKILTNKKNWEDYKKAQNDNNTEYNINHNDPKQINSLLDLVTWIQYGNESGFNINSKYGGFGEYYNNVWKQGFAQEGFLNKVFHFLGVASEDVDVLANIIKVPFLTASKYYEDIERMPTNTETAIPTLLFNTVLDVVYNVAALIPAVLNPTLNWGQHTDNLRQIFGYIPLQGVPEDKQKDYIPYITGLKPGEGRNNYFVDTGNLAADFALEIIADPMNWATFGISSGIKSSLRGVAKKSAHSFAETMATFGVKMSDDFAEEVLTSAVKSYAHGGTEAVNRVLSKKIIAGIEKGVDVVDITNSRYTQKALARLIIDGQPLSNTAVLTKSLNGVNAARSLLKSVESVDKTIIKLAFTQGTYPVFSIAHKYIGSPLLAKARYFNFDRLYKPFVKQTDKALDVFKLDELEEAVTKAYGDDNLIKTLTDDFGNILDVREHLVKESITKDLLDIKEVIQKFKKDFYANKGQGYTSNSFIDAVNEALSLKYGRAVTLEEYITQLKNMNDTDLLKNVLNENVEDFLKLYDEISLTKNHFSKFVDAAKATEAVENITKVSELSKGFNKEVENLIVKPFRKLNSELKNLQFRKVGKKGLKVANEYNRVLNEIRKIYRQPKFKKDPIMQNTANIINTLKSFSLNKGADTYIFSQYTFIKNALYNIQKAEYTDINVPLLKQQIGRLITILYDTDIAVPINKTWKAPVNIVEAFDKLDVIYETYIKNLTDIKVNVQAMLTDTNINKTLLDNVLSIIDDYTKQADELYESIFNNLSDLPETFTLDFVGKFDIKNISKKYINFKEATKHLESIKAITKGYAMFNDLFKEVDLRQAPDRIFNTIKTWISKNNNETAIVNSVIKDYTSTEIKKVLLDEENTYTKTITDIIAEMKKAGSSDNPYRLEYKRLINRKKTLEDELELIKKEYNLEDKLEVAKFENNTRVQEINQSLRALEEMIPSTKVKAERFYNPIIDKFENLLHEKLYNTLFEQYVKNAGLNIKELNEIELGFRTEIFNEQWLNLVEYTKDTLTNPEDLTKAIQSVADKIVEIINPNLKALVEDKKLAFRTGDVYFSFKIEQLQTNLKLMTDNGLNEIFTDVYSDTQLKNTIETIELALRNTDLSETEVEGLQEVSKLLKRIVGASVNYNNYANFLDDLSKISPDIENPELTVFAFLDVLQNKALTNVDKILENPKGFLDDVIKNAELQINSIYKVKRRLTVEELLKPYNLIEEHTALSDAVQEAFLAKKELITELQKRYGDRPIYVLDIETTGSLKNKDSIVDIGFVKLSDVEDVVDGKVKYKNGQQFTAKMSEKSMYTKMPKNSVLKNIISDTEVEVYKADINKLKEVEQFVEKRYAKKYLEKYNLKTPVNPSVKKAKGDKSLEDLIKAGYDVSIYKQSLPTSFRTKPNSELFLADHQIKQLSKNAVRKVDDNVIRQYIYYQRYFTENASELKYENQILSDFLNYVADNVEENAVIIGHNIEEFDLDFIKTRFYELLNIPEDLAIDSKQRYAYTNLQNKFDYFESLTKDDTYKMYKAKEGVLSYNETMKTQMQEAFETYLNRVRKTSLEYNTPGLLINPVPRHIISDTSNLLHTLDTLQTTIELPKIIQTKNLLSDLITTTTRAFTEISISNEKLSEVLINKSDVLSGFMSESLEKLLRGLGVDTDNIQNISQLIYSADAPDAIRMYGYNNVIDFDLINDYFTLKSLDENGDYVIRSYQDGDMISEKNAIAMTKAAKRIKRINEEADTYFKHTTAIDQEILHKYYVEAYNHLKEVLYTSDETGKSLMYTLTPDVSESVELITRLSDNLSLKGNTASFGVVYETYKTIKKVLGDSFDEFIKTKNNTTYNTINQLFEKWNNYSSYNIDLSVLTGDAVYPVKHIDDVLADVADYDYFIHTLQKAEDSLNKAASAGDALNITSNRRLIEVRRLKGVQDVVEHIKNQFDNIVDADLTNEKYISELTDKIDNIKKKIDNTTEELNKIKEKRKQLQFKQINETLDTAYADIKKLYEELKEATDVEVKQTKRQQINKLQQQIETLKKTRTTLSDNQKQYAELEEKLKAEIEAYKQDIKLIKEDYNSVLQKKYKVKNSYKTVTDRFAISQTNQILNLTPEQLYRFMVYNTPIMSFKNVENNIALKQIYDKFKELLDEDLYLKNNLQVIYEDDAFYIKLNNFNDITYTYNKTTRSVDAFDRNGNIINKISIVEPNADYKTLMNNYKVSEDMFKGILNVDGEEDAVLQDLLARATSKLYEVSDVAAKGTLLDRADVETFVNFIESLPDTVKVGFDTEQFRHSTFFAQKLYNNFNLGDVVSRQSVNPYYSSSFVQNLINSTAYEASARSIAYDYMDLLFSEDFKLKNLEIRNNPEALVNTLKENGYKLVLGVENKKGHIYIKDITPNTVSAARVALNNDTVLNNAIVIPYNMYSAMVEQLEYNIYNTRVLKYLRPLIWQYKVWSLIGKIRVPIVNYIDSTIKEIGDTGSVYDTFKYQAKSIKDLNEYNKIIKSITGLDAVNIKALEDAGVDVSQFLTDLVGKRKDAIKLCKLYNEAYADLSKNINLLDEVNKRIGYTMNEAQAKGMKQAHTLRFTTDNVDFYFKYVNTKMTKEEFYTLHEFFTDGPSGGMLKGWQEYYDSFSKTADKKTLYSYYVNFLNFMMKPNSGVERVVRLSEYLALLEQGYTTTSIYSKISKTHFDYSLSNNTLRAVELVKPFTTFRIKNLMYWVSVFEENPRLLMYITDFYNNNNWNLDNINPQYNATSLALDYVAESGAVNTGVQYQTKDNKGKTTTKGLYIKASPSVFDALSILSKPLDTYGFLPPVRVGLELLDATLSDIPEHLIDRYLIENPDTNRLMAKKYIKNAVNSGFKDTNTFEELTYIYQSQHKGVGYLRAKQNIYDEACGGDYSKLKNTDTIKIPKGLIEVYGKRYNMLNQNQLEYAIKSAIKYSYENNVYSNFKDQTSVLEDILRLTPIGSTVYNYEKGIENFKETGNPLLFFSDLFGLYKQHSETNKPIKDSTKHFDKYLYRASKTKKTYSKKPYVKKTYYKKMYNNYYGYKTDRYAKRAYYDKHNYTKIYHNNTYANRPRNVYIYDKYYTKKGKNRWQLMTQSKPTTKQGLKYKLIQWQHYSR